MKTIDISPRILVFLLSLLLVVGAVLANWRGGITPSLAAIFGSLAGSIPKMLERSSITDTPPDNKGKAITKELTPPILGALSAGAIALTIGA